MEYIMMFISVICFMWVVAEFIVGLSDDVPRER